MPVKRVTPSKGSQLERTFIRQKRDHFTFLGNWPPTPPLSHHFALSERYRIYSINRPGRLLNFWILRVGAY